MEVDNNLYENDVTLLRGVVHFHVCYIGERVYHSLIKGDELTNIESWTIAERFHIYQLGLFELTCYWLLVAIITIGQGLQPGPIIIHC